MVCALCDNCAKHELRAAIFWRMEYATSGSSASTSPETNRKQNHQPYRKQETRRFVRTSGVGTEGGVEAHVSRVELLLEQLEPPEGDAGAPGAACAPHAAHAAHRGARRHHSSAANAVAPTPAHIDRDPTVKFKHGRKFVHSFSTR